jgi:hypothetical protein
VTGTARRDIRIDVIRGLGILMIAVDHFSMLALKVAPQPFTQPFITWRNLGWSSAAEFFVFYSGYVVGKAFMPTLAEKGIAVLQARCWYRAWQIYAANVLTYCATMLLLSLPFLVDVRTFEIGRLGVHPSDGLKSDLVSFLTLQRLPMFLDVLPLYSVLLVLAGALLIVARVNAPIAVLLSGILWFLAQWRADIYFFPDWTFNPFAWQLLFLLGIVGSRGLPELIARMGRRLLVPAGLLLTLALALKTLGHFGWSPLSIGAIAFAGFDKTSLGPIRLCHFLVCVVLVSLLMPAPERLSRWRAARVIARVGRYSLECFCLSIVLAYTGVAFLSRMNVIGSWTVLCAGLVIMAFLISGAAGVEWVKSKPWQTSGGSAAPAPGAVKVLRLDQWRDKQKAKRMT